MKKCIHTFKIENMPLQPSTIYFCPWQMSQSAFLPVKPYNLIGNRVRVKSSGLARGSVANARPPGSATFANAQPRDWQGGQMPRSGPGGGGGTGRRWNWLMHYLRKPKISLSILNGELEGTVNYFTSSSLLVWQKRRNSMVKKRFVTHN